MIENIGYGLLVVGLLLMFGSSLEGVSVLIMAVGMVMVIQEWL